MDFYEILKEIKEIKIQGAQNVAMSAASALLDLVKNSQVKSGSELKELVVRGYEQLKDVRPTEPAMRNVLWYIVHDLDYKNVSETLSILIRRYRDVMNHFKTSEEKIAYLGALKIKKGMVVYTHCHSSTVVNILKKAKDKGVDFEVHLTETRPLYQGRITARELSSYGIPVTYYVDSAARLAIKKADLVMIGADAISSTGKVINKIGSEMVAEIANKFEVPVYSCSDSWKFDPLTIFGYDETVERRDPDEFWPDRPKGVKVNTFIFERVDPNLITGVISELGIFRPFSFGNELKRVYPWIFKVR